MIESYSYIDMFGPIYGAGWYSPEINNGLTFRWNNSTLNSTLKIPTFQSSRVQLRFFCAYHPQDHQLEGLIIELNNSLFNFRWALQGPYCVLWGDIELPEKPLSINAKITVPEVIHSPNSLDTRTLGLAINRVEVIVPKLLDPTEAMDRSPPEANTIILDVGRQAEEDHSGDLTGPL